MTTSLPELNSINNEQYLRDLYFNPKSYVSFSGINKIYRKTVEDNYKISKVEIKKFLEDQPTYTLHKRLIKRNFHLEKLWFPTLINNGKLI
jgi:hypothetical protein